MNIFGKVLETDTFVKKLLQYSIIGLGFGINLNTAIETGSQGFLFYRFYDCFGHDFRFILAKILKLTKPLLNSFLQEPQSVEEAPSQQLHPF